MHNLQSVGFYDGIRIGKKKIQGRFVIPSGVRCAHASAIEQYFNIKSVGIITTKSISANPKKGYKEPLYVKYGAQSYINAVGLANPGAEIFKEELSKIKIPENKFLLVSIFGSDENDFYKAAQILAPYADGFELNMSCPHSDGYGLQIGNDINLVCKITKRIAQGFDLPVFVKISAIIPNVAELAGAAIENGAAGITAINTVGPSVEYVGGVPVLSNVVGGMSGEAIRPLGLKALCDIRKVIGEQPTIIGLGGIFNSEHVKSYNQAGADFFGIGSALTNLNTREATEYFDSLQQDIITRPNADSYALKPVDNMEYQKCFVEKSTALTDILHKIKISGWKDYGIKKDTAGKFFFIMIPGIGEKPFALFSYDDREIIVKNVGYFTNKLANLSEGDALFIRGPYGKELPVFKDAVINFVAGGTGISPVYEIAGKYAGSNKIRFFLGGRIAGDIFDIGRFEKIGEVNVATEDGSVGLKGYVTDLLKSCEFDQSEEQIFINVGPKVMIEKSYDIEKTVANQENIWVSIEYQTSCGVGICGKCATGQGAISCVDGPFLRVTDALKIEDCKHQ